MVTDDNETLAALEAEFDKSQPQVSLLTPEMMARRLVWDVVPHEMAQDTITAMELPGVSQDVEEAEHNDSHAREFTFLPLQDVVAQLTHQIAQVQLETLRQVNPNIEEIVSFDDLWRLTFTSSKAVMAELLDCGLVHLPHYGWFQFAAANGGVDFFSAETPPEPVDEVEHPEENPDE